MSAHLVDSEIYGHLWSTPEIRGMLTDQGRLRSWLDILAALAEAQADVGLVPVAAAKTIRGAVTGWLPDPAEVGELLDMLLDPHRALGSISRFIDDVVRAAGA